ncbi:MAG TPA: Wzz/FepE/Etk N-terminal domain-containing protein [Candidatus Didemnitutus sp.]|nr:Wzz/FepE/Etk N-terminal domain-containing protein [Candidatus Didemnitutus sp.]
MAPPAVAAGLGLNLGDIYYVLFRHKWKIILCALAGFTGAVAAFKAKPAPYASEAKLFIKYVVETKAVGVPNDSATTYSLDHSDTLMSAEMEILGSLDLAEQVAAAIGPARLLAKFGGGDDVNAAAGVIKSGLVADARGNVLRVAFEHPDPRIVQPVLREVIDRYRKKHAEIHHSEGLLSDSLTQETDQLRQQLAQTEEELHQANIKAGVISIEDSKKSLSEQESRIRQEIFSAQADLAERSSVLETVTKKSSTDAPVVDNSPEPTPEQIGMYRGVLARQESLRKREQDLLIFFTEENSRVKQVREQLAETAAQRKKMETDLPKLLRATAPMPISGANPNGPIDPNTEAARLTALQAKIKILNSQLDSVRAEAAKVEEMESTISELKRKKERLEANYKTLSTTLEAKRIDDALRSGGVSNIEEIQTPTPPLRDWKKTFKLVGGIGVSGLAFGLGWAFLIELYLDRSIRRPVHVEKLARLPLFLSIPVLGTSERKKLTQAAHERLALMGPSDGKNAEETRPDPAAALGKLRDADLLHPFHETLRDRLISYFESKGLTHKPKLVAVTGLAKDSGVTTTAAGLAATLSETGDGNVLLVDMTIGQGSAQQFYKGKGVVGLEEVLDARNQAQIQDNLFVVGENANGDKLSRILPQRFNRIVPKLKASNFDYIIFDMPPVSQLSITPRLASYMDMVLLVLESEKTGQDVVQRAVSLLAESKAHVGAILNKTKNYVPPQLHQETLGNL